MCQLAGLTVQCNYISAAGWLQPLIFMRVMWAAAEDGVVEPCRASDYWQ
jgi:hypothetical protein